MKSLFKIFFYAGLALGILALVFGGLVMVNLIGHPDVNFIVNDVDYSHGGMAGFLSGVLGCAIAAAVLMVVLPMALMLSLALPLLILLLVLGGLALALVGMSAFALSPLLIFLLPLIWLARRAKKTSTSRGGSQ
jgi:hypothetical protein